MKVSIVVCELNVSASTIESLKQFLEQTLDEIEILLFCRKKVDKKALYILDDFKKSKKINLIKNPCDRISDIFNFAVQKAKGEYLFFYNGQKIEKDAFRLMYRKASLTKADITFCHFLDLQEEILPHNSIFSKYDCPLSLFQIMPDVEYCLFNTNFVKNIPAHFNSHIYSSLSNCFVGICFAFAEKISFLDADLVSVEDNNHIRVPFNYEFYEDFLEDYHTFYNTLIQNKLYDILETSFIKNFTSRFLSFSGTLVEPIKTFLYIDFLNKVEPLLSILGRDLSEELQFIVNRKNLSTALKEKWKNNFNDIIPVVLCCNNLEEFYSSCVTIQSIIEHINKKKFYDIYIFGNGTFTEQIKCITEGLSKENVRISCVNVHNYVEQLILEQKNNLDAWITFIPKILYNYPKIIFLKKDLIVQKDISILLDEFKGEYSLAGALAFKDRTHIEKDLGLIQESFIDTGVMVFTSNFLQETEFQEKYADIFNTQYRSSFQEWLNNLLLGKIQILDIAWNCPWEVIIGKKEVENFYSAPDFVHIINYENHLPIKNSNIEEADRWWKYARKSPFYELILLKMLSDFQPQNRQSSCPQRETIVYKKEAIKKNDMYTLQKKFLKEFFLSFLCLGKSRQNHKKSLMEVVDQLRR